MIYRGAPHHQTATAEAQLQLEYYITNLCVDCAVVEGRPGRLHFTDDERRTSSTLVHRYMMFAREDTTTTTTMDERKFLFLQKLLSSFVPFIAYTFLLRCKIFSYFSFFFFFGPLFSLCQISFGNFALYLFLYARYSSQRTHVQLFKSSAFFGKIYLCIDSSSSFLGWVLSLRA